MKIKTLKRDVNYISSLLEEKSDGSVVCKKPLIITIPQDLEDKGLFTITETGIRTLGNFAIICDDKFCTYNVNAIITSSNNGLSLVTIEDEKYYVVDYEKGDKLIDNLDVVVIGEVAYEALNKFLHRGKVPWYMSIDNMGVMFLDAGKYTGVGIDQRPEMIELMCSLGQRNPDNLDEYHRNTDLPDSKVEYVSLMKVTYGKSSNVNKINGSYHSDGLISSLTSPVVDPSELEIAIRS